MILFRCDNVIFNDIVRLHVDRLRETDEIQDEETIYLGEANTSNDEIENMNSEDFLACGRLKIVNSVEESCSIIHFSEEVKYYWRVCVC